MRTSTNFSKDKGLCGGVNTAVAKQIRLGLATEEAKGNVSKAHGMWFARRKWFLVRLYSVQQIWMMLGK